MRGLGPRIHDFMALQLRKTWMPDPRPGMTKMKAPYAARALPRPPLLEERLNAGLGAAEDQRMNVMRALVGVDRLQVGQHPHYVELVRDAVATVHVARHAGDVERLAAIVALEQRDRRRRRAPGLEQPSES